MGLEEISFQLKEVLAKTGLTEKIRIYLGDFRDPKNPPGILFRPKQKKLKNNIKRFPHPLDERLDNMLTETLTNHHWQISGISYELLSKQGKIYKLKIIICSDAEKDIYEEPKFKERVFLDIKKVIEEYNYKPQI